METQTENIHKRKKTDTAEALARDTNLTYAEKLDQVGGDDEAIMALAKRIAELEWQELGRHFFLDDEFCKEHELQKLRIEERNHAAEVAQAKKLKAKRERQKLKRGRIDTGQDTEYDDMVLDAEMGMDNFGTEGMDERLGLELSDMQDRSDHVASKAYNQSLRSVNSKLPTPHKDELRFFYLTSSYRFHPKHGTLLNITGCADDTENTPVALRLWGFDPHFYVKMPSDYSREDMETVVDQISDCLALMAKEDALYAKSRMMQLQGMLKDRFGTRGLNLFDYLNGKYKENQLSGKISTDTAKKVASFLSFKDQYEEYNAVAKCERKMAWIKGIEKGLDEHYYRPNNMLLQYVDIGVLYPKMVRKAKELFQQPGKVVEGLVKPLPPRAAGFAPSSPFGKPGSPSPFGSGTSSPFGNSNSPSPFGLPSSLFGVSPKPASRNALPKESSPNMKNASYESWFSHTGLRLPKMHYISPQGTEINGRGFEVFEATMDYTVRHLIDQHLAPCHWMVVPKGKYTTVTDDGELKRETSCRAEYFLHYSDLKQLEDPSYATKLPNLTEAALDIECNTNGKRFPVSDKDAIVALSIVAAKLEDKIPRKYVFSLKSVRKVRDADEIFWYNSERELVDEFHTFLTKILNPDQYEHMNGNQFDWPYLINRARILGLPNFDLIGRSLTKRVYFEVLTNKFREKHFVHMDGRINIDFMRRAMDDYGSKFASHNLNYLASEILGGETKEELPYEIIEDLTRTEIGRERLGMYVLKDSLLVWRCIRELKMTKDKLMMARLVFLPPQVAMDRAQNYKITSLLQHMMKHASIRINMSPEERKKEEEKNKNEPRYFFRTMKKAKERKKEKYAGAIVLRARRGFYGTIDKPEKTATASCVDNVDVSFPSGNINVPLDRGKVERAAEEMQKDSKGPKVKIAYDMNLDAGQVRLEVDPDGEENIMHIGARMATKKQVKTPTFGEKLTKDMQDKKKKATESGTWFPPVPPWHVKNLDFLEFKKNERTYTAEEVDQFFDLEKLKQFVLAKEQEIKDFCQKNGFPIKGQWTITLDFQSMYPSIMRWANLSHNTAIHEEHIKQFRLVEGKDYYRVPDERVVFDPKVGRRRAVLIHNPKNPAFALPSLKKGHIPQIQEVLVDVRNGYKKLLKQVNERINMLVLEMASLQAIVDKTDELSLSPEDRIKYQDMKKRLQALEAEKELLDILQNLVKVLMNSIYGCCGDSTSELAQEDIAKTVTGYGRYFITKTRLYAEDEFTPHNGYHFMLQCVYGDTDSVMLNVKGAATAQEVMTIGMHVALKTTGALFDHPMCAAFEKIYENFNLITQKNYAGLNINFDAVKKKVDQKGVAGKRRSPGAFAKHVLNTSMTMLCEGKLYKAIDFVRKEYKRGNNREITLDQLMERSQLSKPLAQYGQVKEEERKKTKGELTRLGELKQQYRLHDFFKPTGNLTADDLIQMEEQNERETYTTQKNLPVSPAVTVARRLAEQCPDNPPTAGSVIHFVIVEGDVKQKRKNILQQIRIIEHSHVGGSHRHEVCMTEKRDRNMKNGLFWCIHNQRQMEKKEEESREDAMEINDISSLVRVDTSETGHVQCVGSLLRNYVYQSQENAERVRSLLDARDPNYVATSSGAAVSSTITASLGGAVTSSNTNQPPLTIVVSKTLNLDNSITHGGGGYELTMPNYPNLFSELDDGAMLNTFANRFERMLTERGLLAGQSNDTSVLTGGKRKKTGVTAKQKKKKSDCAMEPIEAMRNKARPSMSYYLEKLKQPLSVIFYQPMITAGLIPEEESQDTVQKRITRYLNRDSESEHSTQNTQESQEKEYEDDENEEDDDIKELLGTTSKEDEEEQGRYLQDDEKFIHLPKRNPKMEKKLVCDILFKDLNLKKNTVFIQEDSAMRKHVKELRVCVECNASMGVEQRPVSSVVPCLCEPCERDRVFRFRARLKSHQLQLRKPKMDENERIVHQRINYQVQQSQFFLDNSSYSLDKIDVKYLQHFYHKLTEYQLAKFADMKEDAREAWDWCENTCLGGSRDMAIKCEAFTCGRYGSRTKAKQLMQDHARTMIKDFAIPASSIVW